jgi:hypothetical protein
VRAHVRVCVCSRACVLVSYNEAQTRKLESLYALGRDRFDFAQVLSPPHNLPSPTLPPWPCSRTQLPYLLLAWHARVYVYASVACVCMAHVYARLYATELYARESSNTSIPVDACNPSNKTMKTPVTIDA